MYRLNKQWGTMSLTVSLKAAKREKARRLAIGSFWHFRLFMHKDLKVGAWQKDACEHLQTFYDDYKNGKRPKLVIEAPPQHGKSVIINDFVLWLIGKDASDFKIIYAAFSDSLGKRANRRIQRFMNSPKFIFLFPKFKATNPITQNYIGYGEDGYFRNTTTNGAITGESLDLGIIDDPVKGRKDAHSPTVQASTFDWFTSDFLSRFSDRGAFLCILTRWDVNDLIGKLLEIDPKIKVRKYPAITNNVALFPEHKSLEFLKGVKKLIPVATWNSLYQQNPTIAEGNFFKPDFIPIIDVLPPNLTIVRAWDLAATAGGGDYTVGLKFGYDKKTKLGYIIDIFRGQLAPEDVERMTLKLAKQDGKKCKILIPQDPGQSGKAQARNFVTLLSGFNVICDTVSGDKQTRATPVAAQTNVGNIAMMRGAFNAVFIEELRLFPTGYNDDQVDTLSDAYNEFKKSRKRGLM